MNLLIAKILGRTPDAARATLQQVVEMNRDDWAKVCAYGPNYTRQADGDFNPMLEQQLQALDCDPMNEELAAEVISLGARIYAEQEIRGRISLRLLPIVAERNASRLKGTLPGCLESIISAIRQSIRAEQEHQDAHAGEFGLPAGGDSLISKTLNLQLKQAESYRDLLAQGKADGLLTTITDFCLDRSQTSPAPATSAGKLPDAVPA